MPAITEGLRTVLSSAGEASDLFHDLTTSYPSGTLQTAYARREIAKLRAELEAGKISLIADQREDTLSASSLPKLPTGKPPSLA